MTLLHKPVKRITTNTHSHAGRALVVTLMPGASESIVIREHGRRKGYEIPLSKVFQLGARLEADAKRSERATKKKARKAQ